MKPVVKICGLRESDNIISAVSLKPLFLGFIFYSRSPRYAEGILSQGLMAVLPSDIRKTGVFVNSGFKEIVRIARSYSLDTIQLHGDEPPELCRKLKLEGYRVIKVFSISPGCDFISCRGYTNVTDYFLFDTKTGGHGGSGQKFDWRVFEEYNIDHPFFISGGIGPDDAALIRRIANPGFYGVDLNSRFELKPGLKDIERLRKFIIELEKSEMK